MSILVAQKGPYAVDLQAGDYWWCACGRSKRQPFCDGSHQGTGITPVRWTLPEAGRGVAVRLHARRASPLVRRLAQQALKRRAHARHPVVGAWPPSDGQGSRRESGDPHRSLSQEQDASRGAREE